MQVYTDVDDTLVANSPFRMLEYIERYTDQVRVRDSWKFNKALLASKRCQWTHSPLFSRLFNEKSKITLVTGRPSSLNLTTHRWWVENGFKGAPEIINTEFRSPEQYIADRKVVIDAIPYGSVYIDDNVYLFNYAAGRGLKAILIKDGIVADISFP
jgi:hypothetical protein